MTLTLLMIFWFVLIFIGLNLYVSLGLISILGLYISDINLFNVINKMYHSLESFPLLAVPLFILAGELMNYGSITKRLIIFSKTLLGHITGGLAHVNVGANVIMSGVSGSALAEAAGIGKVLIPAMIKLRYDASWTACLTATASVLGPLIPPSIPLVIYAVIASVSAGAMMLAGMLPGLLVAAILMIYIYFYCKQTGTDLPRSKFRWKRLWRGFRIGFLSLMSTIIIILGIIIGIFTPTEAAAATVFYVGIVAGIVYKKLGWTEIKNSLANSALMTSTVLITLTSAALFNYYLTMQGIPQMLSENILKLSSDPTIILFLLSGLVILLGCFLDGLAIMLLVVPVFLPATLAIGIDPIHFGVVLILCMMTGLITPPFGPSLFLVSKISGVEFLTLSKRILPWLTCLIISIIICIYVPWLSTGLPNLLIR
jgi:tripartite ATP-independent transporter DctM subunit